MRPSEPAADVTAPSAPPGAAVAPGVGTLYGVCLDGGAARGKKTCYLTKVAGTYRPFSYFQLVDAVEKFGLALNHLGLAKGDRVAILSENRPEWFIADMGAVAIGCVTTPIYPSYPPARVQHILADSGARAVVVSTAEQLAKVLEVRAGAPNLKTLVVCEPEAAKGVAGVQTMEMFLGRGRMVRDQKPMLHRELAARVAAEDLATIIYTSGTTGLEKGVMLTHANLTATVDATLQPVRLEPTDVHLSFLPLAHVFERTVGYYCMLRVKAAVAFAESIERLPANLVEVRPTILLTVPRVLEKLHAAILAAAAKQSPAARRLFDWALAVGRDVLRHAREGRPLGRSLETKRRLAQRLVFSKILARTGGRLRLIASGGAPLPAAVGEFFAGLGIHVVEGYGLTETSPTLTVNADYRFGTIGRPLPGVEVRIAPDGEILVRSPGVMKGYFNQPELTAEAIDGDGWFHTGDVGRVDAEGYVTITDRKKDLIVLSTGKNVAPQAVEARFAGSPWVHQILVLGDKRKYVAALIVPSAETLAAFARERGLPAGDLEALSAHPDVVAAVGAHVKERCAALAPHERIKRFALVPREFTIEAGEMTPSLKLRRRPIMERCADLIEELYRGGEPAEGGETP